MRQTKHLRAVWLSKRLWRATVPRMKRLTPLVLIALLIAVVVVPLSYAAEAAKPAAPAADRSPGAPIATAISTVTGMAISPLLGTGAYGAYQYFTAKDDAARAKLPWYAQVSFFLPALLIVAACAAKDSFGAVVPPGLKKPLDVLETIENKATGLIAAGAVVPFTMDALSKMIVSGKSAAAEHVVNSGGLAMMHPNLASMDFSWLLNVLTIPFGIAMFAVVWMASHAINVLILLSPWGAIDAALKGARTSLLGLLTLSAMVNPWLGAALSIVVIIVAWFVAGWAFRLTVFGTEFCWDFFTLRRTRFQPAQDGNRLFAGGNLPGVPVRTYGRLEKRDNGRLVFVYRPWLVLAPRTADLPESGLHVGRGLFFSSIVTVSGETYLLLPPRYHGHEQAMADIYRFVSVRDAGLRKAWSVVKELFGGGAAKTQVV